MFPEVFGRRRERSDEQQQELVDRLYEQFGRTKVEFGWLRKKLGDVD